MRSLQGLHEVEASCRRGNEHLLPPGGRPPTRVLGQHLLIVGGKLHCEFRLRWVGSTREVQFEDLSKIRPWI